MCDDCARKFDKTSDMSAEELSASWSEVVNGFASLFEEAWQALSSDDMIIVTDLPSQLAHVADQSHLERLAAHRLEPQVAELQAPELDQVRALCLCPCRSLFIYAHIRFMPASA